MKLFIFFTFPMITLKLREGKSRIKSYRRVLVHDVASYVERNPSRKIIISPIVRESLNRNKPSRRFVSAATAASSCSCFLGRLDFREESKANNRNSSIRLFFRPRNFTCRHSFEINEHQQKALHSRSSIRVNHFDVFFLCASNFMLQMIVLFNIFKTFVSYSPWNFTTSETMDTSRQT